MSAPHEFRATIVWTGDQGTGTSGYGAYLRDYEVSGAEKQTPIPGSSVPMYRGDPSRYSPEELLISALSACHMLWFLHLCADAGISVKGYRDEAVGTLVTETSGGGQFESVTLHPRVELAQNERAMELPQLHARAHDLCFIARSVNFPVRCEPSAS